MEGGAGIDVVAGLGCFQNERCDFAQRDLVGRGEFVSAVLRRQSCIDDELPARPRGQRLARCDHEAGRERTIVPFGRFRCRVANQLPPQVPVLAIRRHAELVIIVGVTHVRRDFASGRIDEFEKFRIRPDRQMESQPDADVRRHIILVPNAILGRGHAEGWRGEPCLEVRRHGAAIRRFQAVPQAHLPRCPERQRTVGREDTAARAQPGESSRQFR